MVVAEKLHFIGFAMRSAPLLWTLTFALAAASCSKSPLEPSRITAPLTLSRFSPPNASLSYNSGFVESRRLVVQDATTWREVWGEIWRNVSPAPALPSVDFSRETVVVAALGQRPTGGFSIFVESATDRNGDIVVRIRSVAPGPNCVTTQALTQPVDAARLSRQAQGVTLEEVAETTSCQ